MWRHIWQPSFAFDERKRMFGVSADCTRRLKGKIVSCFVESFESSVVEPVDRRREEQALIDRRAGEGEISSVR